MNSIEAKGDFVHPIYQLGGLRVVVGANHLLNELRNRALRGDDNTGLPLPSSFHRTRLERSERLVTSSSTESIAGTTGNVEWYWYHMGSGHQFTTWAAPTDWEAFFVDRSWMRLNAGVLNDLLAEGYRFGTITEFVELLASEEPEILPNIVEGGWDPQRSEGVYTWMGKQASEWENDSGILALAWRSRAEVRKCEAALEQCSDSELRSKLSGELDNLWKQQLLAESSDPLGWAPGPNTVMFGRRNAEMALELCSKFMSQVRLLNAPVGILDLRDGLALPASHCHRVQKPLARAELVGSGGAIHWTGVDTNTQACEVQLRASGPECGIRFMRDIEHVVYCPSGMEDEPAKIDLGLMGPSDLYLPLANGLVSLGEDLHLIRQNEFGQVAVHVSKADRWLTFSVKGPRQNKVYRWRFIVFKGQIDMAVKFANAVNWI